MEGMVFHEAPTIPAGFAERLRQFDSKLRLSWSPWEGRGQYAHWVVQRRVPEREKAYVERHGIFRREELTRRETWEFVTDWTNEDGTMRVLDNRLMEWLAERDPGRYDSDRFEGFKRMMRTMGDATAKAREEHAAALVAAGIDEGLCHATVPTLRGTIGLCTGAELHKEPDDERKE